MGTVVLKSNLSLISTEIADMLGDVVEVTTREILANSQESMRGTKSGRVYQRKGRSHIAAASGEAPAIDTGFLINSGSVELSPDKLTGEAGYSAEYAPMLELHDHPFLTPATEAQQDNFRVRAGAVVAKAAAKHRVSG